MADEHADVPIEEWELTDHIRVGVRAWNSAESAVKSGGWNSSLECHWVEIDGIRVPGHVIDVKTKVEQGFQRVEIGFIVSKFETVPMGDTTNEPPAS